MKTAQKLLQRLIVLGIIVLIAYQLYEIGWREVLGSLPTHPLFYLLVLVLYTSLPITEMYIYRQVWTVRMWDSFKAFLTKQVYNNEVMGYSGEFYLFLWGRKRVDKADKEIFKSIRDNTIISSITSNMVVIVLLTVLLYTGTVDLPGFLQDLNVLYMAAGAIIVVVIIAVVMQFRHYLFDLSAKKTAIVFTMYLLRFLLHHAGMMLMWMIAIPGVPWTFWVTMLALLIVVNRIPFMPSKDLVFLWVGIEYARILDVTIASVAGMLLVYSALRKVFNLVLFILISYYSKSPDPEQVARKENHVIKE